MITLNLPPEEEAQLRLAASRRGQDVGDYLLALARRDSGQPVSAPDEGPTLAETLAGRIGLFRSEQPSDMARDSEEEFGKIMDEKKRQGRV